MHFPKTIILLMFLTAVVYASGQKSPNIIWGEKDLTWEDFEGQADLDSPYKAVTYSQITFYLDFNKDSLIIGATAEFVPNRSWSIKHTDYLLNHEQVHFDIMEYVTRLFRKELLELTFESYDDIKPKVYGLFKEFTEKRKEMQNEYDKDTDHSKIRPRQENWNKKIDRMLKEHAAYTNTNYHIYIGYLNG